MNIIVGRSIAPRRRPHHFDEEIIAMVPAKATPSLAQLNFIDA
jgi:hypothetical protein